MAFSLTRPSSPPLPPPSPVDDHLSAALHAALSRVHEDMQHHLPRDKAHNPHPDKSRIDIVLDSDVLALKGTAVDVEPALLSGYVVLALSEATSIKEITLQFRGKARIPPPLHEPLSLNPSPQTYSLCTYDWSFLEGEKRHSHTLKAGKHFFPFSIALGGSLPSSISLSTTTPASSISYKLRATAVRPGLAHNLHVSHPVSLIRSFASESLEYQQTLEIENTWPDKLMYTLVLPHRAWAAGDTLTALCKFIPLAKGVHVVSVITTINETVKIPSRGSDFTKAVVTAKHEVGPHGKLKLVSESWYGMRHLCPTHMTLHPLGAGSVSASTSPADERSYRLPDLTLRQIPSEPSSSSSHSHSHQPTASTSSAPPHDSPSDSSHDPDSLDFVTDPLTPSSIDLISPLSLTLPPTLPPSHSFDPIHISYRIRWSILMSNLDGHTSELRCSLPITILDGRLLDEARAGGRWVRRVVLGEYVQGEGEGASAGIFGEGEPGEEEEGETLPSYNAHVRDRVANAFLPAGSTVRVANPYISPTSNMAPLVSPIQDSTSTSWPPVNLTVNVSQSGTSSPLHPNGHGNTLPHAPSPNVLDWVNSELLSRSPHTPSDSASQVPSRLISRAPSPERRIGWGTGAGAGAGAGTGGASAAVSPAVSGPETYTHSPPASRTRGTLLNISMKPLPSGWLGGGSRSGSYSSLVGLGHGHGHGHGHGLGMTSSAGASGSGSGGLVQSRSFGNLALQLQPLDYGSVPGHSHSRPTPSVGGSGAHTPHFSGTHSPHSPRTPPAEIPESAIWGRGFTEINPSSSMPYHPQRTATDPGLGRFFVDDLDGGEDDGVVDGSVGADDVNAAPDYRVASQGFIGGVPPLSSLAGLPSYEEAAGSGVRAGQQGCRRSSLHDGRLSSSRNGPHSSLYDGRHSNPHDDLHPILHHRPYSSPHHMPRLHSNPDDGPHPGVRDGPHPTRERDEPNGEVALQLTVPRMMDGGEES
ncbi:hypothetical protein K503DRAFT_745532 [Rhizopogon vinicolor AM-OR11-026]|uniref:Arrestin C-terminal-like domain-containing protein n=1 Tax=Rhizopogon vinicolor AM-OR11-026 TaxID=1314800 RepID=A0A1B7MSX5_9AGAM|nr:hypothetical protein K503DRAFT_745532 [Rhizopogon vinicolor AM-OR11-026]